MENIGVCLASLQRQHVDCAGTSDDAERYPPSTSNGLIGTRNTAGLRTGQWCSCTGNPVPRLVGRAIRSGDASGAVGVMPYRRLHCRGVARQSVANRTEPSGSRPNQSANVVKQRSGAHGPPRAASPIAKRCHGSMCGRARAMIASASASAVQAVETDSESRSTRGISSHWQRACRTEMLAAHLVARLPGGSLHSRARESP
ncbi:hypothetical protein BD289DRAFT_422924 [Coniella lustricola]|uniref:Uncharacterized protein n=1 Tax=Coniella lustricola TaxID=2025994 RepID=A0A2T3AK36_9PEZI|nr:hypothetical protein BD289DRAFT_422924 [Coniella lustricola]